MYHSTYFKKLDYLYASLRGIAFHIKIHFLHITHPQMLGLLSLWPHEVGGGCLTGRSVLWSGMALSVVLIAGVDLLQIDRRAYSSFQNSLHFISMIIDQIFIHSDKVRARP